MKYESRSFCLNGWWDYAPAGDSELESAVPSDGWAEAKYLVPSLADKSLAGVRRKGDKYYQEYLNQDPTPFCDGEHEFLFDNHDYPVEWMAAQSGWARRTLSVDALSEGKRRFLKLDAVAGRSEVWINGEQVSVHEDAFLPNEIDVTDHLKEGDNELAVLIKDYERHKGEVGPVKTMTPSGNMMSAHFRGIWQDVWLIERGAVFVSDTTVRTSYREKTLTLISEITNLSSAGAEVTLKADASEWAKGCEAFAGAAALEIPEQAVTVAAGESATVEITVAWTEPKLWQPESPNLYWLRTILEVAGVETDRTAERFGFREVWIEGPNFLLNGFPVHFFSDWGHKVNQLHHTEAWNRCWFNMMKAENFNHSRLHTHPHPKLIMDLADEEGIMITGETAIHGSGGEQAADEDVYWEAAEAHIRAFVRRDKNHPSLLLWSVENEMRWNQDTTDKTKRRLPELYKLFRQLDPTREAYHEGDSSMWNENQQAIMSRHYGKECGGYGWWDKQRPLHAGEMSAYHYMGPNTNFHTGGGDGLWADYTKVVEAAAYETKWIVEAGRTQGTAAFGPWNISCLCNLRMTNERVELDYEDWATPGVKPQFIQSHSAEFEFWKEDGPRYTAFGRTNEIQASAFRPFAVIDLSHRRSYFGGKTVERTVYLVNDTSGDQTGQLFIEVRMGDHSLVSRSIPVSVGRGRSVERTIRLEFPDVTTMNSLRYQLSFRNEGGEELDRIEQAWKLCPQVPECGADRDAKIRVVGEGPSLDWLDAMGFAYEKGAVFDGPVSPECDLLILERDVIEPGSRQNRWIEDFLQGGGRVLLLEQKNSLFPNVGIESKPQIHGFPRAYGHRLLEKFSQEDLQFWGEDPFASMDSDAQIAHRLYQKGSECLLQPIVDAGEGGFGLKLPEWIVLGELRLGQGKLLASQLRMADKSGSIPEAGRLFAAMLEYLLSDLPQCVEFAEAEAGDTGALLNALAVAEAGGQAFVRLRKVETLKSTSERLGSELKGHAEPRFHAVRRADLPELSGISHVDVSGIDGMTYCFGAESVALADFAIEPVEGLEPLLVSPTRAYLEECHIHGQRVEALRTHGASRFLFAEAPKERVLLGRVRYGKGWVYLDVFGPPQSTHERFARYESMLRRNLGAELAVHALSGDAVPQAAASSPGFPNQILSQSVGEVALRKSMIANTVLSAERMAPTSMLRVGEWTLSESVDGKWASHPAGETAFYTCLYTPRARKIVMEDSGIPNPESLTCLEIEAPAGEIELVLNGRQIAHRRIEKGRASFRDLELVQSFNQVLLLWKSAPQGEFMSFCFRDIMRNPETEFRFLRVLPDLSNWEQAEF